MTKKKVPGKTHWKESRKENGNLNQKAGPMTNKKKQDNVDPMSLFVDDRIDEYPTCKLCGSPITYLDVIDWNCYCQACYSVNNGDYKDTLDDESIYDFDEPFEVKRIISKVNRNRERDES